LHRDFDTISKCQKRLDFKAFCYSRAFLKAAFDLGNLKKFDFSGFWQILGGVKFSKSEPTREPT